MSIGLKTLLIVLAILCFIAKAIGVSARIDFGYLGWAFLAAGVLLA